MYVSLTLFLLLIPNWKQIIWAWLLFGRPKISFKVLLLAFIRGFPGGSDGKESTCNEGDWGVIPGSGRSPGEGNGYPLQYSCLENSMDREAGRLQSMGSQRVGHNWVTNTVLTTLLPLHLMLFLLTNMPSSSIFIWRNFWGTTQMPYPLMDTGISTSDSSKYLI